MNNRDFRTLRGQLLMVSLLFVGSAGLAVGVLVARPWIDRYLCEKYQALPASLESLATSVGNGKIDEKKFERLGKAERLALYEDWMQREQRSAATPAALVAADPDLYLSRAERTLVCGNQQQRELALRFLQDSGAAQAAPILETWQRWATRRKLDDLAAQAGTIAQGLAAEPADNRRAATSSISPKDTKESDDE